MIDIDIDICNNYVLLYLDLLERFGIVVMENSNILNCVLLKVKKWFDLFVSL